MELLQSMKVFAKLAELGSFTRTAEAMQMGRPLVTIAIQELEASLGVRLFQRTTRKVRLTAEGELFLEHVTGILNRLAEATSLFGNSGAMVHGRLRIDIPAAFAQQSFINRLQTFSQTYPELTLTLGVTDRTVDLVAESVDCALRIGELPDSSMIARQIGSAVMITCAAPGYLHACGTPKTVDDLTRHQCVNFLSGLSNRPLLWHFSVNGEDYADTRPSAISVNESNTYVQCGVAGFGLIQAPGIAVAEHLASGALVEVLAPYRPNPRPVSVLYPSRTYLTPQIQCFIDWLRDQFMSLDPLWLRTYR